MEVYLLKSKELSSETFENVIHFFRQFQGPIKFIPVTDLSSEDEIQVSDSEDELAKLYQHKVVVRKTWNRMFHVCKEVRKTKSLIANEPVVLLTDYLNEHNWFLGSDHQFNGFVLCAEWEQFFPNSDIRFPIAYQIVSLLLKQMLVKDFSELEQILHLTPKGCLMDFCIEKKDITHKMRTADVCTECLTRLEEKKIPRNIILQMFNIMDRVRENMLFKTRYPFIRKASKMCIKGIQRRIFLTDFGNLEIRLTPLEKTIYLLFLNHTEGLGLNGLTDHINEIHQTYSMFSNQGSRNGIVDSVNKLVDPLGNLACEKIAKIKRKFIDALGEKMAAPYYIQGPNGGLKKIELDRDLVTFERGDGYVN